MVSSEKACFPRPRQRQKQVLFLALIETNFQMHRLFAFYLSLFSFFCHSSLSYFCQLGTTMLLRCFSSCNNIGTISLIAKDYYACFEEESVT